MLIVPGGIISLGLVIGTARSSILEEFELAYTRRRALYKKRLTERSEARRKVRHLSKEVKRGHSRPFGGGSARGGGGGSGGIRAIVDAGAAAASTVASPSHDVLRHMSRTFSRDPMSPASGMSRTFSTGPLSPASPSSASDAGEKEQQTSNAKYETGWFGGSWAHGFSRRPKTPKDVEAQPDERGATLEVPKLGTDETSTADGSATSSNKPSTIECSPEKIEALAMPSAPLPPDPAEEMQRMEAYLSSQRKELDESWKQFKTQLDASEKKEFWVKLGTSLGLFVAFWTIGAGVFSATEGWTYFQAFYFAFVFSSTIGYGDFSPVTPAGRAFFTVWSLFGIGILTILFAVLSDAWASMAAKRSIRKKGQPSAPRRLSHMLKRKSKTLKRKLTLTRTATTEVDAPPASSIPEKNEESAATQGAETGETGGLEAVAEQDAEAPMEEAKEDLPLSASSEAQSAQQPGSAPGKRGRSWARLRSVTTTTSILASPVHHKASEGASAATPPDANAGAGADEEPLRPLPPQVAPRDMPITLARSAMAFHEHAQRFIQTQRPLIAHALARIPAMAKAEAKVRRKRAEDPTHRIRISEADRVEILRAAGLSDEPGLSAAVSQWLEMVALEGESSASAA